MPPKTTDEQIERVMDVPAFVESCDEAFRLYGRGPLKNLPREESVEKEGDIETFRLELAGEWQGVLVGKKLIVEESDVSTGRLGERSATIELTLEGESDPRSIDAELITNRRTGAAAALGAKYLASSTDMVSIVGTGRIAEDVALAIDHLLSPETIRITSRKAESREAFVERVEPRVGARVEPVEGIEETVGDSGVVVTCVPTPEPVIRNDMLLPDAHLSVVAGDPRTVQLQLDVLTSRTIVVDHLEQAKQSGDFVRYKDELSSVTLAEFEGETATIGDAALGRLESSRGTGCVTYFTGMAVQDLHAAYTAVRRMGT